MARLVTKFKFLKPGDRKGAGGYAKYIATREGVERIDDSQRLAPATKQQEKLIEKILKDFPDSATLLEYADYQSEPNMGNASEFIFRAIEDNADDSHHCKRTEAFPIHCSSRPAGSPQGRTSGNGTAIPNQRRQKPFAL